ncbi:MAG: hypothetical protein JXQ73_00155 [Phycisphaerae bacterium]|nr:hypothetical protein [Phycisphaerae bacterium]
MVTGSTPAPVAEDWGMRTGGTPRRLTPAIIIQADGHPDYDGDINRRLRELAQYAWQQLADARRFDVAVLSGPQATKAEFESALVRLKGEAGLVIFFGHGCLCGDGWFETQPGMPPYVAMTDGVNSNLLESKVVYAVACHSAKVLGQRSVTGNHAARCYIGYAEELYIYREDGPAEPYIAPLKAGIRAIAKRKRCIDAYHAIRDEYLRRINYQWDRGVLEDAIGLYSSLDALSEPLGDQSAFV